MKTFSSPVLRFVIVFFLLYVLWFILYDIILHPDGRLDGFIIDLSILCTQNILEWLGYKVFTDGYRIIGIEGTSGLFVGDSCNAITLAALFAGFIIAYGGNVKVKTVYIASGILSIFLLNIVRISSLAIIDLHFTNWTRFNHTYTFTLLMYAYIFFMWYLWINKWGGEKKKTVNTKTP